MLFRIKGKWEDMQVAQQQDEIIRAQDETKKKIVAADGDSQQINEEVLILMAEAKREWADLTDFDKSSECINKQKENEFTRKKITVKISR